jgi:hypothetical protein
VVGGKKGNVVRHSCDWGLAFVTKADMEGLYSFGRCWLLGVAT